MKSAPRHSYIFVWLVLPVVLSCGLAGKLKKVAEEAQKPTLLTSTDSKFQMTLPGGWREDKQLNAEAVLQGSNRLREMYVVVIRETKTDFGNATLDDYANLTRRGLGMGVTEPRFTDVVPAYGANYPAKEYEVEGTVSKVRVKYLCTVIETSEDFYQVLTWTLPSRFAKNESELRSVIQSFKLTDTATATATP